VPAHILARVHSCFDVLAPCHVQPPLFKENALPVHLLRQVAKLASRRGERLVFKKLIFQDVLVFFKNIKILTRKLTFLTSGSRCGSHRNYQNRDIMLCFTTFRNRCIFARMFSFLCVFQKHQKTHQDIDILDIWLALRFS